MRSTRRCKRARSGAPTSAHIAHARTVQSMHGEIDAYRSHGFVHCLAIVIFNHGPATTMAD